MPFLVYVLLASLPQYEISISLDIVIQRTLCCQATESQVRYWTMYLCHHRAA